MVLVNSRSSRGGDCPLPSCPSPMPSLSRWRLLSRPIRMHFQAPVTCWSYCYKKTLARAQAPQPQAPWALAWALGLVQGPTKGEAPQPVSPVSNAVWYFPETGGGKPHPSLDHLVKASGLVTSPDEASRGESVSQPGSISLLHPSTGSSQSSHTSKYFGSIDSSEAEAGAAQARTEPGDQVIKYVLQDPIWLLMANADQHVMMTYQVPSR